MRAVGNVAFVLFGTLIIGAAAFLGSGKLYSLSSEGASENAGVMAAGGILMMFSGALGLVVGFVLSVALLMWPTGRTTKRSVLRRRRS